MSAFGGRVLSVVLVAPYTVQCLCTKYLPAPHPGRTLFSSGPSALPRELLPLLNQAGVLQHLVRCTSSECFMSKLCFSLGRKGWVLILLSKAAFVTSSNKNPGFWVSMTFPGRYRDTCHHGSYQSSVLSTDRVPGKPAPGFPYSLFLRWFVLYPFCLISHNHKNDCGC